MVAKKLLEAHHWLDLSTFLSRLMCFIPHLTTRVTSARTRIQLSFEEPVGAQCKVSQFNQSTDVYTRDSFCIYKALASLEAFLLRFLDVLKNNKELTSFFFSMALL